MQRLPSVVPALRYFGKASNSTVRDDVWLNSGTGKNISKERIQQVGTSANCSPYGSSSTDSLLLPIHPH